jgi:hypothetical protein
MLAFVHPIWQCKRLIWALLTGQDKKKEAGKSQVRKALIIGPAQKKRSGAENLVS